MARSKYVYTVLDCGGYTIATFTVKYECQRFLTEENIKQHSLECVVVFPDGRFATGLKSFTLEEFKK